MERENTQNGFREWELLFFWAFNIPKSFAGHLIKQIELL
jgi:hypothetical protein